MNHDPQYLLDLASRVTQRILPSKMLAEEAAAAFGLGRRHLN